MKAIVAFGLTVVLLAGPASGFAAVGSEQAREANAGNETGATDAQTTTAKSPTMSAPNVPSHDGNSQLGSTASHTQTPGVTVGPGSTNHDDNRALGYGKGAGENSSVGKGR